MPLQSQTAGFILSLTSKNNFPHNTTKTLYKCCYYTIKSPAFSQRV